MAACCLNGRPVSFRQAASYTRVRAVAAITARSAHLNATAW